MNKLNNIFHAVIWTEATLKAYSLYKNEFSKLNENIKNTIWGEKIIQVLISPSGARKNLINKKKPDIYIHPNFELDTYPFLVEENFPKDLIDTGVSLLFDEIFPKNIKKIGKIGIIADRLEQNIIDRIYHLFHLFREKNENVQWVKYRMDINKVYFGLSLLQLAEKILELKGIAPNKILWLFNIENMNDSLDYRISEYIIKQKNRYAVIFDKNNIIDNKHDDGEDFSAFLHISNKNISNFNNNIKKIFFSVPISLHPKCEILRKSSPDYRMAKVFHLLDNNIKISSKNLDISKKLFCSKICENKNLFKDHCQKQNYKECPIFIDKTVFDHKSGAISFNSYTWYNKILTIKKKPWADLINFFTETIEIPWQKDRPNYRRILFTPTTVLLRGEDYYSNLKNISPIERVKELVQYTDIVCELIDEELIFSYNSLEEWKLILATIDQLRNSALQFAWLSSNIDSINYFKDCPSKNLNEKVLLFMSHVISIFYIILTGKIQKNDVINNIHVYWNDLKPELISTIDNIKKKVDKWQYDPDKNYLKTVRLIRRWREADHPGENLFIALQVINDFSLSDQSEMPIGVGIGWGGIELPLVYSTITHLLTGRKPTAYASHYSKYAKDSKRDKPKIAGLSINKRNENIFDKDKVYIDHCKKIILFDDNSLSGGTIEKIVEDFVLNYGAEVLSVYITRLSGERRYDQMRMDGHGVLNPYIVGDNNVNKLVHGYLGETPFSRTWSRKIYLNPIGIFSLSKRRILELLHANSSANRFDREGF